MANEKESDLESSAVLELIESDLLAMDRRMADVDAVIEHWKLDGVPEHDRLATLFSVAVHLAHDFGMNKDDLGKFVAALHDSLEVEGDYCTPIVTATAKASLS